MFINAQVLRGRELTLKVMLGGGMQSIRVQAELRQGKINAVVVEGVGWWWSCRNAKGLQHGIES
jgi:hypothetical protein